MPAENTDAATDHDRHDRDLLTAQIIGAMPDWVNAMVRLNDLIAERMGVVVTDFQALHTLNQHGPTTGSVLAQRTGLTPGSASRMIDRLESAGCVRRIPDPDDRRRTLVDTTPEGLARIEAYYAGLTRRTETGLAEFTPEELAAVLRFIHTSRTNAAAEVQGLGQEE